MREQIGHYRIVRKLGEGGMGVVYAAHDERLGRPVAIKMIKNAALGEARSRFWREARAAAGINHPNICQVYEIGEEGDELFIVMELLEGESLAQRIQRAALPPAEAIQTALGILAGLQSLHAKLLVHRDVKPGNVFLVEHGVKLLDFGLVRPLCVPSAETEGTTLTQAGMIAGTPRYMSPEQLSGRKVDPRSDLFAAGAILFEMISGRAAFGGSSALEIFHAVVYEQPPALVGSDPVPALDIVIRRALAKSPEDRYASAEEMARELRALLTRCDSAVSVQARAVKRLIVLPFRLLRADPEIEFLAFGLADAISASLSGLESLVVRSSLAASRYAGETDLRRIASETDVDLVLTGTLLRAGDQLRASTQLAETASGTLVWSQTSQGCLRDVFQLQDELVGRIVDSLALPLSAREQKLLRQDVPANATAYEYYLRANELGYEQMSIARDLYARCVQEDPQYAPAWARLGRCYRVLGKFGGDPGNLNRAESALRRALDLNSDLALAHNMFAYLEADLGRAQDAMVRLLLRAKSHRSDPELFAGLVHVCRFCGLLEASIAAHEHACRLDPAARTSVTHAYFLSGDYARALQTAGDVMAAMGPLALALLGRQQEALRLARDSQQALAQLPLGRAFCSSILAVLEGGRDNALATTERAIALITHGPEELFYLARHLAYVSETGRANEVLARAVEEGFFCYPAFVRDPWLDSLRATPEFKATLQRARERHLGAVRAFVEAGGEQLLGVTTAAAGQA
jgi:non-specific serine/threonine protein kinase